jgi:hypothetical protein
MPPKCSIGQGLTWSWAYSTGHPASDQSLDAAAKAAWSYAQLCAWTYLNDEDSAHDLMDFAVQKAAAYAALHPDSPPNKLTGRIKSAIRRRAKQLAAARSRELSYGSLLALERVYTGQPEAEQRVFANELLARLSPLPNRSLSGARSDIHGGKLPANSKWTTLVFVVHTSGR